MRESAHWADSATIESLEAASFFRRSQMRSWLGLPWATLEFPAAMQAFRTSPRHFVRFTGLPRNISRKPSSLNDKSDSNRGRKSESFSLTQDTSDSVASPSSREGNGLG